jgi:hypothetical protein
VCLRQYHLIGRQVVSLVRGGPAALKQFTPESVRSVYVSSYSSLQLTTRGRAHVRNLLATSDTTCTEQVKNKNGFEKKKRIEFFFSVYCRALRPSSTFTAHTLGRPAAELERARGECTCTAALRVVRLQRKPNGSRTTAFVQNFDEKTMEIGP